MYSMYVMYVFVYVCARVRILFLYVYACMYVCYVCMYGYVCICIYVCAHVDMYVLFEDLASCKISPPLKPEA